MRTPSRQGFTLLETIIAMAILALALMAIFNINSVAVSTHAYTKRLTVATLLARSKMTDIEQELFDKGFNADDDEMDGDFSDEGWPSFHWRAKIVAPKTDGVPPEQLISAIFNIPLDPSGGGLEKALTGAAGDKLAKAAESAGLPPGAVPAGAGQGLAGLLGPMAGMATQQLSGMVTQITQTVREVHLTVSWKDGKNVESIDVVTHVVSTGQGSDRNGATGPGGTTGTGPGQGPGTWFNPKTSAPAVQPMPCQNDGTKMCEGGNPEQQLVWQAAQNPGLGNGVLPPSPNLNLQQGLFNDGLKGGGVFRGPPPGIRGGGTIQ